MQPLPCPDLTKFVNLPWLKDRTIFLTQHGSRAYGTSLPTSDTDYKGVAIPPRAYFTGFTQKFEQAESGEPEDLVVYEVRKFMALARDCNPNIIEVLWTDPSNHVVMTHAGRMLVDARDLFLSKKARHTFSGYAMAQMKRINVHYKWLKNPPLAPPRREDFGLRPENEMSGPQRENLSVAMSMVVREVATWHDLDWTSLDASQSIALRNRMTDFLARMKVSSEDVFVNTAKSLGMDDNLIALLVQEKAYRAKKQDWDSYQTWLKSRNPERAAIEAQYGYDTKHAMHLVRLLRMCREILTTGKVVVRRPDAEELLTIRAGSWSYESLVEWATAQDQEMDALYESSKLPHSPNTKALDHLCMSLVDTML